MTSLWEAYLFDLDGVLVDSAEFHLQAYRRAFAAEGLDFPAAADGLVRQGGARDVVVQRALQALDLEHSRMDTLARRLCARKGSAFNDILERGELGLMPGVELLIGKLVDRGVPLGVVTNSRAPRRVLAAVGIGDHFSVCVGREEVVEPKPSPAGYLYAARALGVDPQRALAFEDTTDGVQAARSAGMSVVGIGSRNLDGTILQAAGFRDPRLERLLLSSRLES